MALKENAVGTKETAKMNYFVKFLKNMNIYQYIMVMILLDVVVSELNLFF